MLPPSSTAGVAEFGEADEFGWVDSDDMMTLVFSLSIDRVLTTGNLVRSGQNSTRVGTIMQRTME